MCRAVLTDVAGAANVDSRASSLHPIVSRRSDFETWITAQPYERDAYRWPKGETKHAWPGQYKDIAVQLAWEAWCESDNDRSQQQNPPE